MVIKIERKWLKIGIVAVLCSFLFIQAFSSINILQTINPSLTNGNPINVQLAQSITTPNVTRIISQIPRTQNAKDEMWNNIQYTMLIITPNITGFVNDAQQLADWNTERGIPTLVVANYSAYYGQDIQESIRNAIISYYHKYPIQWVLLLGDTNLIPQRKIVNTDSLQVPSSYEPTGDQVFKPTDFYYAELNTNWNPENNSYWGALHGTTYNPTSQDWMGWTPQVSVGRFPVSNVGQLDQMINKTITYEKGLDAGSWMNQMLGVSTVLDLPSSGDLDGEDEGRVMQYVIDNDISQNMNWTHILEHTIYFNPPSVPNVVALSYNNVEQALNTGVSILAYGGHGAVSAFSSQSQGLFFSTGNVGSMTNFNKPTFVFADACDTNAYDYDSLGKEMVLQPTSGAIGYIGAMRISWYFPNDTFFEEDNRGITKLFFQEMFQSGYYQQGKALTEAKIAYVNSDWFKNCTNPDYGYEYMCCEQKTITTYNLLGDPTVDIFTTNPDTFNPLINSSAVIYGGNVLHLIAETQGGVVVPFARLTIYSNNREYHTYQSDANGNFVIDLPIDANSFNYTLWAHNMIMFTGTFTTQPDNTPPQFLTLASVKPTPLTVDSLPVVHIDVEDNESGVSDVWFLLSSDNFSTFYPYPLARTAQNSSVYAGNLPKFPYGTFQYTLVAFDYANNYNITLISNPNLYVTVPIPYQYYLLLYGNIGIFCLVGIIIIIRSKKLHQKLRQNIKESSKNNII